MSTLIMRINSDPLVSHINSNPVVSPSWAGITRIPYSAIQSCIDVGVTQGVAAEHPAGFLLGELQEYVPKHRAGMGFHHKKKEPALGFPIDAF